MGSDARRPRFSFAPGRGGTVAEASARRDVSPADICRISCIAARWAVQEVGQ